jgi:hypothetical protein
MMFYVDCVRGNALATRSSHVATDGAGNPSRNRMGATFPRSWKIDFVETVTQALEHRVSQSEPHPTKLCPDELLPIGYSHNYAGFLLKG